MHQTVALVYEELVSFPTSKIRSPGSLLGKVKTEAHHPKNNLRDTNGDSLNSHSTKTSSLVEKPAHGPHVDVTRLPQLRSGPTDRFDTVLSEYKIEFIIHFDPLKSSFAIDYIMEEIEQLPPTFIERLNMKIFLTDKLDNTKEKCIMTSYDIQNQETIKSKLYKLIFNRLLLKFPKIVSLWLELDANEEAKNSYRMDDTHKLVQVINDIEDAFYAVMLNRNFPKLKNDVTKLKHLLSIFDPIGFSNKWFKEHNHTLKDGLKVSFCEDS